MIDISERCSCADWKKWCEIESGGWALLNTHGVFYSGPLFKYCPFCKDRLRDQKKVNLSEVMKIWEILHIDDTGDIGFSDLEKAIDKIVGVNNDILGCQPSLEDK